MTSQAIVPSGWAQISETEKPNGSVLPIEIGTCRVMVNGNTDLELLAKVKTTLQVLMEPGKRLRVKAICGCVEQVAITRVSNHADIYIYAVAVKPLQA